MAQALCIENLAQYQLAPVALHLVGTPHYIGQAGGRLSDFVGLFRHRLELLCERSRILGTLLIGGLDSLLQFCQPLFQGLRDVLHALTVLNFQLRRGSVQHLRGQIGELFLHSLQLLVKLLLAHLHFCIIAGTFALQLGLGTAQHHLGRHQFFLQRMCLSLHRFQLGAQ